MVKSTPTPSKQQSISNFFTKKTVNGPTSQPSQPSQPPPTRNDSAGNLYDAESDDEPLQSITNGASKRPVVEDVAERPAKRARAEEPTTESSGFFPTAEPRKQTSTKSKVAPRTERYLYTSPNQTTGVETLPEEEDDEQAVKVRKEKEELHRKFVKKLGHPDSLKSSYHSVETEAVGEGDEDEGEDETPPPAKTKKKGAKTGKLTPMEIQILDIKRKHMDTLLIVEVGYKFKFYGEDARTAAKELSIVCIPGKFRYDERELLPQLSLFSSDLNRSL